MNFPALLLLVIFGSNVMYQGRAIKYAGNYFYVSLAGNDNNPGTKTKPFKSIKRVNKLQLKPGHAIFFRGGDVFTGTLSLTIKGTRELPVIISAYGPGRPVIDGGKEQAMVLKGNYFRLGNINVKGMGRKAGNTTSGIQLTEVSNALIENMKIEGFQKAGLDLYNCKNTRVRKIEAFSNGYSGINVGGSSKKESVNLVIKDCKTENNAGDPTNLGNHSGNGILVGMSDSVLIDHCVATNNGWDMPRTGNGPVGIWAYESDRVIIQYCISFRNKTSKGGSDGGGFDLDGGVTNSVIQYCLSYENQGAGYGLFQYEGASRWQNNILRYCISIDDATTTQGSGGIFIWSSDPDKNNLSSCIVHNNVVYSRYSPAIKFEPSSLNRDLLFSNNIFIGSGKIIDGPSSGEKFIGNTWWSSGGSITFRGHSTLADWANATGQEKLDGKIMGRQKNPLLKGPFITALTDPYRLNHLTGFMLQDSSPLKNTGLKVPGLFAMPLATHDFYNTAIPQGINIEPGVHELK